MFNIESALIAYLSDALDCGVRGQRPEPMPDTLVTVERTGGGGNAFMDFPQVTVHVYAKTNSEASKLAGQADELVMRFHENDDIPVGGVERNSLSRNPYIQNREGKNKITPRYTGLYVFDTMC